MELDFTRKPLGKILLIIKNASIDAWVRIAKYTELKLKGVDCCHEEGFLVNVHARPLDS